jgi:arylsulfatase A-like enzyme
MVSMVDRNVGQVLDLLRELGIEDNTIVFFTGDNGGQDRFDNQQYPRGFFGPNVNPKTGLEFRGEKGTLYEGGLRIPFLVRWPGRIKGAQVSDLVFYQPDVLPTLAQLTGATAPKEIDGLSILPTLLGEDVVGHKQKQHEYLYWEYRKQTAVRMNHLKAIQPTDSGPWELYDLDKDVSEKHNIAAARPAVLAKMKAFAHASHEPVRPGTFTDRIAHERDRWAKWGDSRGANALKGKTKSR